MAKNRKRSHSSTHGLNDAYRNAAIAGTTTTAGLTINRAVHEAAKEAADYARVKNSTSFDDLLKQMKPGDVVFSRSTLTSKYKIDVKQMLQAGMGSRHYHASMFVGGGRIAEHPGAGYKSWMPHMRTQLSRGEDVVVYRPKVSDEVKAKAVERAKGLIGRNYASSKEVLTTGFRSLIGLPGKIGGTSPGSPITCVTVPQQGYKEIFGSKFSTVQDLKDHPAMEMVARLQRKGTAPLMNEKALYRVGYGVAKYAKWGLLAAGVAFGATMFVRHMMNKKKSTGGQRTAKAKTPTSKPQSSGAAGKLRFIRRGGHVIPIHVKGGT